MTPRFYHQRSGCVENGSENSYRITRINISESGGTSDEAAVMAVERQPLVMS